jgi:MFS family permease
MAILALTYMDRMVFGVVQEDIKRDLGLTDTQLGILTGIAFTLFYCLAGIPIARWADRGNRITIISLTTAAWGITVSLCAGAGSFLHLLLIRIGIAAGEAGCSPPAHSLIPEYFDRAERPRAVARFMLGVPVGLTLGYLLGGWLNELYGWRITFILLGVPGLLLAVLAATTLKEPRRIAGSLPTGPAGPLPSAPVIPSFAQVVKTLSANNTFRHLLACFLIWYFSGWAIIGWQPAFFIRSHGLSTGELGMYLAVGQGVARLVGTWLGGEWASRYASGNERRQLGAISLMFVLFAASNAVALLAPNYHLAFALVALGALGEGAASGPMFATIQTLVAPRMRATAIALISLLPAFIGNGFGPLAVGALSDAMRPWSGGDSLRYALLVICPGYCWAAWHCWRASRTVSDDLLVFSTSDGKAPHAHLGAQNHVVTRQ